MQTIPSTEDIRARRTVKFVRGHLAEHTTWIGIVVGYNAAYDTVKVYVYEPGSPEWVYEPGDAGWLTKTSYARADVEWYEPAEKAAPEHRETTIRIHGVERVVRTERATTVKALEGAHTKAVKAALEEMHKEEAPAYAERVRKMNRNDVVAEVGRVFDYYDAQRLVSRNGGAAGTNVLRDRLVSKNAKRRFTSAACNWDDARKGWPKVRFSSDPSAGLTEVEPGHWTDDPALFDVDEMPAAA